MLSQDKNGFDAHNKEIRNVAEGENPNDVPTFGQVFSQNKTYTGTPDFTGGIETDTISESTSNAGVTIDSVKLKDGGVSKSAGTIFAGFIYTAVQNNRCGRPRHLGTRDPARSVGGGATVLVGGHGAVALLAFLWLSIPEVLSGLLLLFFAARTGYLPVGGMHSLDWEYLGFWGRTVDLLRHLALPALVVGLFLNEPVPMWIAVPAMFGLIPWILAGPHLWALVRDPHATRPEELMGIPKAYWAWGGIGSVLLGLLFGD